MDHRSSFVSPLLLAAVLGSATSARAQQLAWRLPPLGAVEYRREWRALGSESLRSAEAARAAPAKGRPPDRYLHRLAPAPWLCQGELQPDQRSVQGPVRDLRDLLRAVAFDLGSRSARARCPGLLPFGDVMAQGSWSNRADNGIETLRGTISARPPVPQPGETKATTSLLLPHCCLAASGTLQLERTVDAANGLVTAFHGQIDLVVQEPDKNWRRIVVEDRWSLVAVRDNQDADFRKRVAAAIAAGTGFVRDAIDEQKSFLQDRGRDERNYGSGRLAFGLLTLLHGHVRRDDPVLQRGFAELRRRRLEDSYSLAVALMALRALHAPPNEAALLREGSLASFPAVALPERDHKLAQQWVDELLRNVDPRGAAAQQVRFNYTAGPRYDTSLQQYGLLGLWAAASCGLELPAGVFAAAARQLLAVQGASAGSLALRWCTHAQLRAVAGTGAAPDAVEQRASLRGFAYQEADEPPFGSMTSAGVGGLLLARAGMAARGELDRSLAPRIDAGIRDGFAWLAHSFSVRCNPGFAERADHHVYYWLYGLERACELAGIARLQDRDWYYEGAVQLLSHQQANGSFRAEHPSTLLLDSTCFAVLFLAKATAAAPVTGR